MRDAQFTIPGEHDGLLQVPRLAGLRDPVGVGGDHVHREEIFRRILSFSGNRGIPISIADMAKPVFATAHQPGFHHAGILAKQFALRCLAQDRGAIAVQINIDNDAMKPMITPVLGADSVRRWVPFHGATGAKPFEKTIAESQTAWNTYVDAIRRAAMPALHANVDRFADAARRAWSDLGGRPPLGMLLDTVRRNYLGALGIAELPGSILFETESFREFVASILREVRPFRHAYNECLAEFGQCRAIKSASLPARYLREEEDAIETPFWVIDDEGGRHSLWRRGDGSLSVPSHGVGHFDGRSESLRALTIRPKAIAYTLYQRRYLCDFFIHGVGGATYDIVTNAIYRRFWGESPPAYACVSLSWRLPLAPALPELSVLRKHYAAVRNLEKHPLDYLGAAPQDLRIAVEKALIVKKSHLVALACATRAEKHAIGAEIKKIDEYLSRLLAETKRVLEQDGLAAIERHEACTARDYPYFLFDPELLYETVRREI